MGVPCETKTIIGDGNCLFRSLAFAISGSEKEHRKIRRAVTTQMERNESKYINCLRQGFSSVANYLATSRMKYVGTWATEVEIQAAADLFITNIFTFTRNTWLKYSSCNSCDQDVGIYLKHCSESHYEVVTCVKVPDGQTCAALCLQRCDSRKSETKSSRSELDKRRIKYGTSQEKKEEKIQRTLKRYRENEIYRDSVKTRSNVEYATNLQHKERNKQLSINKYATDMEHRGKVKQASINKYSTDMEHRENVKQLSINKYSTNEHHRETIKRQSFEAYHTDPQHKAAKKQRSFEAYHTKNTEKSKHKDINYVTDEFRKKINTGPEYVCSVCHRTLFKHQVLKCRKDTYLKRAQVVVSIAERCITDTYLHQCSHVCDHECNIKTGPAGSLWICYTCQRKILNGKMPEESVMNNLALEPIPPELHNLNSLEQHLIGMNIPFMRLVSLPKGGQNGVHGPVVCVPSNITDVTEVLPRTENVDLMIRIKLKRKLTYKGHYEYKFVNTEKIKDALLYLKQHNNFYRDVTFNNDWVNPLNKTEHETQEPDDTCTQHVDEENNDENNESEDVDIDETLHDRQQHGGEGDELDSTALYIYATNAEVDDHNANMLKK
ncbi:uncharacterized protein LOC143521406 [Brachyhypopomus gauderio]|uniref:uncharacterized protein LOC143521406 n=1 Tax=Brachyhypopomus gauderio TaxID=698409 RepID=UPI004042339B